MQGDMDRGKVLRGVEGTGIVNTGKLFQTAEEIIIRNNKHKERNG